MCVRAPFFLPGCALLPDCSWALRGRGGAHFTVVLALSVICLTNGPTNDNCDYYVLLYAKHYGSFCVYFPPII